MESPMKQIAMFPLLLMPLPGELIPLHIFEPRYRELLKDMEERDMSFGIFCTHEVNKDRLGGRMRLESILKRYPTGESDIVVRCEDVFSMGTMFRTFNDRKYPGGEIQEWNIDTHTPVSPAVYELFLSYQEQRNISGQFSLFSSYQIAAELNLDVVDRYRFLTTPPERSELFLTRHLQYQLHLIREEKRTKDLYFLN